MNEFNATTDDDQASKLSTDGRSKWQPIPVPIPESSQEPHHACIEVPEPPSDPFPQPAKAAFYESHGSIDTEPV
ncbi:hypothetical protein MRX96_005920 [Rhipicephalus microplus]